jgi:hypothetical protein
MAMQENKYDVGRAKAIFILVILTLLYMMAYMDRSVMTVVVEQLKADIGLTDGQIGFLQTTFMVGVGLMMMPCGVLVDRWSRRKAIGLMAIIWSIATFLTGLVSKFSGLVGARFLTSKCCLAFADVSQRVPGQGPGDFQSRHSPGRRAGGCSGRTDRRQDRQLAYTVLCICGSRYCSGYRCLFFAGLSDHQIGYRQSVQS